MIMASEQAKANKAAYDTEYMKKHIRQITIGFNENVDEDMRIYDHVKCQKNQTQYIKGLVREDMGTGK